MDYVIFDLEWNQPADENSIVRSPVYLSGEIVQIGAVKLDDSFQIVDTLRLYIKPRFYTKMHRRIASLTGIRDRDIAEKGLPFPEAFARFQDWCGKDFCYMTWSTSDLPMLADNILLHGLDLDEFPLCCDVQRIFSREIMRSTQRYSLDHALEILGEQGDTAHDALHDAKNTAMVCRHLDLDAYIDEYTGKVFFEKHNGRVYGSRQELLAAGELASFRCPWCSAPVSCEAWLPYHSGSSIAMGVCEEGDEFLVQLDMTRHSADAFYARRLFCEMSDDLWEIWQDRKAQREAPV